MGHNETITSQIKQVVKDTDDSAMVILFGSRATGTAVADSDWDILILLNKPAVSLKKEQLFRHKLYDLELKIGEPISIFVYGLGDWNSRLLHTPLHQNVQSGGMFL